MGTVSSDRTKCHLEDDKPLPAGDNGNTGVPLPTIGWADQNGGFHRRRRANPQVGRSPCVPMFGLCSLFEGLAVAVRGTSTADSHHSARF